MEPATADKTDHTVGSNAALPVNTDSLSSRHPRRLCRPGSSRPTTAPLSHAARNERRYRGRAQRVRTRPTPIRSAQATPDIITGDMSTLHMGLQESKFSSLYCNPDSLILMVIASSRPGLGLAGLQTFPTTNYGPTTLDAYEQPNVR